MTFRNCLPLSLLVLFVAQAAMASTGEKISITEAPWSISLRNEEFMHGCGGTLIAPRWIVTAGHCVDWMESDQPPGDQMSAWGGNANLKYVIPLPRIKQIYLAPGFKNDLRKRKLFRFITLGYFLIQKNDVGLIELESDAVLPEITHKKKAGIFALSPAGIAKEEPSAGSELTFAGWGTAPRGTGGKRTKEKVSYDLRSYREIFPGKQAIMAEFEKDDYRYYREIRKLKDQSEVLTTLGKKMTCQGDSGSGLFSRGENGNLEIVAVVSGGTEDSCNASEVQSSTFTKVTPFRAWIAEKTGIRL